MFQIGTFPYKEVDRCAILDRCPYLVVKKWRDRRSANQKAGFVNFRFAHGLHTVLGFRVVLQTAQILGVVVSSRLDFEEETSKNLFNL